MCVCWSLLDSTLFQSGLLPPSSELVLHSCKCLVFFWLHFGGTREQVLSWGGAVIFYVECITSNFLTFFQFEENSKWITEGFSLGRLCSRCVEINRSCTKIPRVYHKSDLHRDYVRRGSQFQQKSFGVTLCWTIQITDVWWKLLPDVFWLWAKH